MCSFIDIDKFGQDSYRIDGKFVYKRETLEYVLKVYRYIKESFQIIQDSNKKFKIFEDYGLLE